MKSVPFQSGEHRCGNLLAQRVAEITGAEQVAEEALGVNAGNFGDEG